MPLLGTSSVSLEIKPYEAERLADLLHQVRTAAQQEPEGYTAFMRAAPSLHYMSLSITKSHLLDPLLVIEVNYDLPAGRFWLELDAALGPQIREMLRCCKRPRGSDAKLYDAVTEEGTRLSVAAYLERRAAVPSVYHHGNRGLVRARIVAERDLFEATRKEISANEAKWRKLSPSDLHKAMRDALLPQFPWLARPAASRFTRGERVGDYLKFAAAVVAVLLVLALPGFVAAQLMTMRWFLILTALAASLIGTGLYRLRGPVDGTETGDGASLIATLLSRWKLLAAAIAVYLVTVAASGTFAVMVLGEMPLREAWSTTIEPLLLSLLFTATVVAPGLVLWLRRLELDDSTQHRPHVEPEMLAEMARREDWLNQNHMISIVPLKPGSLRSIAVRAGHFLLKLYLRMKITDGYLGGMRTIHFAHWAFVDNGARLMFHSNYDLSWEAYLDDFIEKAHEGLTLAWSNGLGFPPTRMLVGDGASHGRLFKAWARQSMGYTSFWYCAYPNLIVDQIERNYRIAKGLHQPSLGNAEAAQWLNDL